MLKVFATQVVVSRGYDGAAAIKFSEKGDAVRFRIGKKVYDPNAENNARWINLAVKGFGPICERIKKMQLKDGSFVNLIGRLDEDVWEDQQTHEKKSAMVIILDDIEYASGGGKSKDNQNTDEAQGHPAASTASPARKIPSWPPAETDSASAAAGAGTPQPQSAKSRKSQCFAGSYGTPPQNSDCNILLYTIQEQGASLAKRVIL